MAIVIQFPTGVNQIRSSASLYQWDYGQKIQIYGLELPQIIQVHFCDRSSTKTIVRLGNKINNEYTEVAIPDCLLENEWDINAFIFICSYELATWVGENTEGTFYKLENGAYVAVTLPQDYVAGINYYIPRGHTEKRMTIPVIKRKEPENFVSEDDPVIISMIEESLAAVNTSLGTINALYDTTVTYEDLRENIVEPFETDLENLTARTDTLEATVVKTRIVAGTAEIAQGVPVIEITSPDFKAGTVVEIYGKTANDEEKLMLDMETASYAGTTIYMAFDAVITAGTTINMVIKIYTLESGTDRILKIGYPR